jgi:hypothetical protein
MKHDYSRHHFFRIELGEIRIQGKSDGLLLPSYLVKPR